MEGVPMNGKVGVNKCNRNGERSWTGGHGVYGAVTQGEFLFEVGKRPNAGRNKQASTKW